MTSLSRSRPRRLSLGLLAAVLLPLGCGGDEEPASPNAPAGSGAAKAPAGSVENTVQVDGSSTVFRISDRAREAFSEVDPKVNVIVDNHGTGGGFGRYLKGEVDVVDASRAATEEEELKAKTQALDWTRFVVGYDGITLVVNKDNDFVKELSVAQLKTLFEPESKVKTWKDLNSAWPDRKIILYTPDKDSGTFEYFTEAITAKGKQRADVQPSSDDNFLVKGVSGDADGLGYFGYAYYAAHKSTLRAVPIKPKDDAPAVEPNLETILKKTYSPLARPLYIYVKKSSMKRPAVAAFVSYYLDHVEELAKSAKYVPPTEEDRAANKKALPAASPAA
jgi:phosphate transport system substrate-binding protein